MPRELMAVATTPVAVSYQNSSSTFPTNPMRGHVLLVTVDGTAATKINEQWLYDGGQWVLTAGAQAVSGTVVDNTIADPSLISQVGRYLVPATGLSGDFVGQANKYADFDGLAFTFSTPTDGQRVQITSGANAGQVFKYALAGNSWALQTQTTGIPVYAWALTGVYSSGNLAIKDNTIWQANADIPANTPFVVGTTGATWRQINSASSSGYMAAISNAPQNVAQNAAVAFHTVMSSSGSDISRVSTTRVSLQPGSTYKLTAHITRVSTVSSWGIFQWYNVTTGALVGLAGFGEMATSTQSVDGTGTAVSYVTPTVPSVFELRQTSPNTVSVDSGYAFAEVEKVATSVPVVASSVDYGQYTVSGTPAVGDVALTLSRGNLSVSSGTQVTLIAGRTYRLFAQLQIRCVFAEYAWTDASNNVLPGASTGYSASVTQTDNGAPVGCVAYVTPTVNTVVKLRIVGANSIDTGTGGSGGVTNFPKSVVTIDQIGSAPTLAAPASAPVLSTDASGNFREAQRTPFFWSVHLDGSPVSSPFAGTLSGNATYLSASSEVRLTLGTNQGGTVAFNLAGIVDFSKDLDFSVPFWANTTADGVALGLGCSSGVGGFFTMPTNGGVTAKIASFTNNNTTMFVNGVQQGAVQPIKSPFGTTNFTGSWTTARLRLRRVGSRRLAFLYVEDVLQNAINITTWTPGGGFIYITGQTGGSGSDHYVNSMQIDYI